ncbi:MAG: hypothetical protein GXP62_11400 [Oligoflexia bacterium]|nr:hypothetical protein [Oligoflexia bacterium]
MPPFLTADELSTFENIPETDLVDLAIELDIPVGESIARAELLDQAIIALGALARQQGLPFSPYDRDDLEALHPEHLGSLAHALGVAPRAQAIIRAGRKVYRRYRKDNSRSQVPLQLPMFIAALARYLAEGSPQG